MTPKPGEQVNIAIACGGTGGHLFPGLAVADQLIKHGAGVTLMISPKEIDQLAVKTAGAMRVVTLPAIGLTKGRAFAFFKGFLQSYKIAARCFAELGPQAVLAMGGFTSAPPILAARRRGISTFLHESNTIPGRANRWLSRVVERAFIGFPDARQRLRCQEVSLTGTPVRDKFRPMDPAVCRAALGLDPARPTALVMGGSQGAHGINELISNSLSALAERGKAWQWFHLSGSADVERLTQAYRRFGLSAKIYPFFADMDLAMAAATAAVSRSGASSLAELAAMRLPALLIPFPAATDNHQFHNARAFELTGAARLIEQRLAKPEDFVATFSDLMCDEHTRRNMQQALSDWHKPNAAEDIARTMLTSVQARRGLAKPAMQSTNASSLSRTGADDPHRTRAMFLNPAQPSSAKLA